MAKSDFSLDFKGFEKLAYDLGSISDDVLKKAVNNAMTESKNYINNAIGLAMDKSSYNFSGSGYSKGNAKKSLKRVSALPVEWHGNLAKAYIGVSLNEALEVAFIIHGTIPYKNHKGLEADTNLYRAIKVKGKYKTEVQNIQRREFNKVIEGVIKND